MTPKARIKAMLKGIPSEALKLIFAPSYSKTLNVPLAEHVLRLLASEHLARGGKMTEPLSDAIRGPDYCEHGRSTSGTCPDCDSMPGEDA